jgi:hypothetical protein
MAGLFVGFTIKESASRLAKTQAVLEGKTHIVTLKVAPSTDLNGKR